MSDTRRHCDPEWKWAPGVPEFDELFGDKIFSRKHQEKDRRSKEAAKSHKFVKGRKNSRYNLQRKAEEVNLKEQMENVKHDD